MCEDPPVANRLKLTVKTARIAHNRHGPEAKKDNAVQAASPVAVIVSVPSLSFPA
jgi:hypothetical protein